LAASVFECEDKFPRNIADGTEEARSQLSLYTDCKEIYFEI